MTNPFGFGPPTDPVYVRFLEGLKSFVPRSISRWNAKDEKWYSYALADWGMEDLGLADTSPDPALRGIIEYFNQQPEVIEFWVPDLFNRLRKAAAAHWKRFPQAYLVWTPAGGGDWRSAFRKQTQPIPQKPSPEKGPYDALSPDCVKRVEQVREWLRRDIITHDTARRLIDEIVAECT